MMMHNVCEYIGPRTDHLHVHVQENDFKLYQYIMHARVYWMYVLVHVHHVHCAARETCSSTAIVATGAIKLKQTG